MNAVILALLAILLVSTDLRKWIEPHGQWFAVHYNGTRWTVGETVSHRFIARFRIGPAVQLKPPLDNQLNFA